MERFALLEPPIPPANTDAVIAAVYLLGLLASIGGGGIINKTGDRPRVNDGGLIAFCLCWLIIGGEWKLILRGRPVRAT